ncbi:MAG: TolC family protein [Sphingobacteriales bacterium]|jgi:outer membrane protein|nr:TolC family protein [Sphingobacteriales bacterium]OJV97879.1 MAG: transporter [Sphingobacteriales bacterium 44-61]
MCRILYLSTFLLLLTGIATAQDNAQLPAKWTLEDCINYAKENNIQINTLKLSSDAAKLDWQQSKNNRLPNVNGTISQSLVNSNNADPVIGGFQTQANFSSNYGINSSMTIYNGGYLNNDIRSKSLSLESANLTVQETTNNITLSITQAFLNILLAKENITYLKQVLATSDAQLKQSQQRFDAGSISKKDLLQFQSQLASDNYNLVTANNNYQTNIVNLKQLLQLPASYQMEVAEPASVEPQQAVVSLNEAMSAAQEIRPEVKNSEVGVSIAETELAKTKAGRLPTVSLGANLSSGFSDNRDAKYFSQLNNNFYQSLGATIAVPIFSRKLNKTNIAKSKIAIEQAKLDLLNTKTVLNQQVEQAYINLRNAQAQFVAAQTQLKAAEESYHITDEQLKLGAVNAVDVMTQRNTYVQALQSFVQAKYSAVLYNKIYDFYTGKPVTF